MVEINNKHIMWLAAVLRGLITEPL